MSKILLKIFYDDTYALKFNLRPLFGRLFPEIISLCDMAGSFPFVECMREYGRNVNCEHWNFELPEELRLRYIKSLPPLKVLKRLEEEQHRSIGNHKANHRRVEFEV